MSQSLQVGWQRAGHEMAYYREQQQEDGGDRPRMYIMSFLIQFPHSQVVPKLFQSCVIVVLGCTSSPLSFLIQSQDTVYLAHCYPYRYSDMMLDLGRIRADPERSKWMTQKVLCHTLAGNIVIVIVISHCHLRCSATPWQGTRCRS